MTGAEIKQALDHLQKCLMALEKIRGISGPDSIPGRIAQQAINNVAWDAGGTPLSEEMRI